MKYLISDVFIVVLRNNKKGNEKADFCGGIYEIISIVSVEIVADVIVELNVVGVLPFRFRTSDHVVVETMK